MSDLRASAGDASFLRVKTKHRLDPFVCAFLPLGSFPLTAELRAELIPRFETWFASILGSARLVTHTFLEMNKLPLDKSAPRLSANGRQWLPSTGLGVFPDQAPPRLWTEDDFLERDYGTDLPALMNTVFYIRGGDEAGKHAFRTMLGSGSTTLVLAESSPSFLEHAQAALLPRIQEEALRGHPFYMPLLTLSAVEEVDGEQIRDWLGPARVYVRESVEDNGILVLSSTEQAIKQLLLEDETAAH